MLLAHLNSLSKLDKNSYYNSSAYYNLKEYDLKKLTPEERDYLQNIFFITSNNFDIDTKNWPTCPFVPRKSFQRLTETIEHSSDLQLIHQFCIFYKSATSETPYSFLKENWGVSGYKSNRYYRDLSLENREKLFLILSSTNKKLKFKRDEYPDYFQWLQGKGLAMPEDNWIEHIFRNPEYFNDTKQWGPVEGKKTSRLKKTRNGTKSFAYRSPKTANEIVEQSGLSLLKDIVRNSREKDIENVSNVLSELNLRKLNKVLRTETNQSC